MVQKGRARLTRDEMSGTGRRLLGGTVEGRSNVEVMMDKDGRTCAARQLFAPLPLCAQGRRHPQLLRRCAASGGERFADQVGSRTWRVEIETRAGPRPSC
jgi:hypothetical protein